MASTIPLMGKDMTKAGEILASRVRSLIGETNLRGAPLRIEKAAASRGLIVTHSTLQRILNGEGAHLDKLEDLAAYFGTDVWRLLCHEEDLPAKPTAEESIHFLACVLDSLSSDAREVAAQSLQTLARAPDSKKAREALALVLTSPSSTGHSIPVRDSIVGRVVDAQLTTESRDIHQSKNKT